MGFTTSGPNGSVITSYSIHYTKLYETLIVSGTKAAGFSDDIVPTMTRLAKEVGVRVILDVRGQDLVRSLPFGPDVVKPNLAEFVSTYLPDARADSADSAFKEAVAEKAGAVARESGSLVVLTRGASAVWTHDGSAFREFPIAAVPPVSYNFV